MPTTKPRGRQLSASPRRARNAGASPSRAARKPARARKVEPEARRQEILDAALCVFAERGFEAARLEDVAARAGVAKGTLYLYFRDKEALFEELVRGAVSPIIEAVSRAASAPDVPAHVVLETFFALFEKEVLGTKRKLLLRLIIAEGPRFPRIAEFYYREVVTRGMALMRGVAERAAEQGEFAGDAAARFPQLIVAPLILAVVWDSLFARIDPLDVGGLLRAHRELLAGKARKGAP
jgi:AcrR family transcriptional regulator